MDSLDELVMTTDQLKTQVNELSRMINDMAIHVNNVGDIFKQFYEANNKIVVALDRRISRLESK